MTKEKEDRLDEFLTGQIGQWRDHWLDTLPPVTQPHAFSSGFRRRMERLLRCAEAYPCGRPRLRLALLLAATGNRTPLDIMQPGGSSLHVHIPDDDQGKAFIDGPVDLVARGRVWLPDAQA